MDSVWRIRSASGSDLGLWAGETAAEAIAAMRAAANRDVTAERMPFEDETIEDECDDD